RRATGSRSSRAREQLVLRDVAEDAGGVADDDHARRDVLRHDGTGPDERLFPDLDSRTEDRATSDPRAAPDRRAGDRLLSLLRAAHEVVLRRPHPRSQEELVLEC